jgi:hypothetical protein
MYCPSCGAEAVSGASFCTRCGARMSDSPDAPHDPPEAAVPPPPGTGYSASQASSIPTYLPYAILVTLFCCLPLGIPGIIYAARTSSRAAAGDFDGARADSKEAKKWTWISFWAGIISWFLYGAFFLLVAILDESG